MKSVILATIAALLFPLNAVAIQLFTFYAPCELGLIDTSTDTSTPAGSLLEWSVEAMDYGPDGMLYATVENGCWVHGNANWLAIIDPATRTVYPIGFIGWDDVDALSFSPSGELFGVSIASYELITIDPDTGAGTSRRPAYRPAGYVPRRHRISAGRHSNGHRYGGCGWWPKQPLYDRQRHRRGDPRRCSRVRVRRNIRFSRGHDRGPGAIPRAGCSQVRWRAACRMSQTRPSDSRSTAERAIEPAKNAAHERRTLHWSVKIREQR